MKDAEGRIVAMIYVLQAVTADGTTTRPAPFASVKSAKRAASVAARAVLTWTEENDDDLAAVHEGTRFVIMSELVRP